MPPLDGDTLIFIDYRADRMRQIVEAFGIKPQFETETIPNNIVSTCVHVHVHILHLSLFTCECHQTSFRVNLPNFLATLYIVHLTCTCTCKMYACTAHVHVVLLIIFYLFLVSSYNDRVQERVSISSDISSYCT